MVKTLTLLNGQEVSLNIDEEVDGKLFSILLSATIGTANGISSSVDEAKRRDFLLRYVTTVCAFSEFMLKQLQAAESLPVNKSMHIIENFLDSLNKEHAKDEETES